MRRIKEYKKGPKSEQSLPINPLPGRGARIPSSPKSLGPVDTHSHRRAKRRGSRAFPSEELNIAREARVIEGFVAALACGVPVGDGKLGLLE